MNKMNKKTYISENCKKYLRKKAVSRSHGQFVAQISKTVLIELCNRCICISSSV